MQVPAVVRDDPRSEDAHVPLSDSTRESPGTRCERRGVDQGPLGPPSQTPGHLSRFKPSGSATADLPSEALPADQFPLAGVAEDSIELLLDAEPLIIGSEPDPMPLRECLHPLISQSWRHGPEIFRKRDSVHLPRQIVAMLFSRHWRFHPGTQPNGLRWIGYSMIKEESVPKISSRLWWQRRATDGSSLSSPRRIPRSHGPRQTSATGAPRSRKILPSPMRPVRAPRAIASIT